jgi:hypothetical protein
MGNRLRCAVAIVALMSGVANSIPVADGLNRCVDRTSQAIGADVQFTHLALPGYTIDSGGTQNRLARMTRDIVTR